MILYGALGEQILALARRVSRDGACSACRYRMMLYGALGEQIPALALACRYRMMLYGALGEQISALELDGACSACRYRMMLYGALGEQIPALELRGGACSACRYRMMLYGALGEQIPALALDGACSACRYRMMLYGALGEQIPALALACRYRMMLYGALGEQIPALALRDGACSACRYRMMLYVETEHVAHVAGAGHSQTADRQIDLHRQYAISAADRGVVVGEVVLRQLCVIAPGIRSYFCVGCSVKDSSHALLFRAFYCRFKYDLVQSRNVQQYRTRGRDDFLVLQHRMAKFERLPSEVGVKLTNRLPEEIKSLNGPKKFKTRTTLHCSLFTLVSNLLKAGRPVSRPDRDARRVKVSHHGRHDAVVHRWLYVRDAPRRASGHQIAIGFDELPASSRDGRSPDVI
ncbi:hypothetical protein J6590_055536 [Homalodisca vitripennis]|nr:hypothetical protein J6590_055536 [Homalodisca vitripennis]